MVLNIFSQKKTSLNIIKKSEGKYFRYFVGAVLFQLINSNPSLLEQIDIDLWKKMISNANKAGARTCEFMGAMEAFKHLNKSIFN